MAPSVVWITETLTATRGAAIELTSQEQRVVLGILDQKHAQSPAGHDIAVTVRA